MTWQIECACGTVLRAATQDEAIRMAQRHAHDTHEIGLTTAQAAQMSHPV